LGFEYDQNELWKNNFKEILESLNKQVKAGKIRHIGLSNETAWGAMKYLELHKEFPELPRMQSVQNPYSLLNRSYEVGLAEVSVREQMGLLAYSPMGFGVLSGKYLGGKQPEKARVTLFSNFDRYSNEQAVLATEKYAELAKAHGITPAQLSLAFVNTRPFVTANIIGATRMDQLKENIGSINVDMTPELYEGIQAIHKQHPIPSP
jgi:aryl-alcohol dehydrogenase-like predicted oxidoreductase